MSRTAFPDLPIITQVATLATFFMAWVMIGEFIIDRHGLDGFLPFYRVGELCPYEAAVFLALVATWVVLRRRAASSPDCVTAKRQ